METVGDAAVDAEAPQHDQPIRAQVGLSVPHKTAAGIDIGRLGLQRVEMVGRPHAKADVALKVARTVVVALFAGPVLGEVLCSSHDELDLVEPVGHGLRVNGAVEMSVHGGEVDEGLVVEVGGDEVLELDGQTLDEGRGHGMLTPWSRCDWLLLGTLIDVSTSYSGGRRHTCKDKHVVAAALSQGKRHRHGEDSAMLWPECVGQPDRERRRANSKTDKGELLHSGNDKKQRKRGKKRKYVHT